MAVWVEEAEASDKQEIRTRRRTGNQCSRLFVVFSAATVLRGLWGKIISLSALPEQPQDIMATTVRCRAIQVWECMAAKATITRLLLKLFPMKILLSFLFSSFVGISSAALRPLALRKLIQSVEASDSEYESHVWLLIFLMLLLAEGFAQVNSKMLLYGEVGTGFRCSVGALIQTKAIALAPGVAGATTPQGLIGNDVSKNYENFQWFAQAPLVFFTLAAGAVSLMLTLGSTGFLAIGLTIFFLSGTCVSAMSTKRVEQAALKCADKRLGTLLRVLQGIRAVKFNAWETRFLHVITQHRAEECEHIRRFRWLQELGKNVGRGCPILIPCMCFIFQTLFGVELDPSNVFPALFVFEALRTAFVTVSLLMVNINNWLVSCARIEHFLSLPEIKAPETLPQDSQFAVQLTSACFEWPSSANPSQKLDCDSSQVHAFGGSGVTLCVPRGAAVALVGKVGSGKSSFLGALLGDMRLSSGKIFVDNFIGYAPQRPFVVSGTLRYNVVLGRPWDEKTFLKAVHVACLVQDLEDLPAGADTEIGERGVTLSGGQQQRVSVARAIYGCPRLLLLDDPLAAVDPHVASDMFEGLVQRRHECSKANQTMTVVMALNQPQFIFHFDRILLFEDCAVKVQGSLQEFADKLGAECDLEGANFSRTTAQDQEKDVGAESNKVQRQSAVSAAVSGPGASLVAKEKTSTADTLATLRVYWQSMGCWGVLFLVTLFMAYVAFGATGLTLRHWVQAAEEARADKEDFDDLNLQYCIAFASVCLLHAILIVAGGIFSAFATVGSSEELHNKCVARVLQAPVAWFDSTPSGRLSSRFSSDCALVDNLLSLCSEVVVSFLFSMIAMAITICIVAPLTVPIFVICAACFSWLLVGVDRSNRMVRRHANIASGPVLGVLDEVGFARGQTVVRAMHLVQHYSDRFDLAVDAQNKLLYNSAGIVMWSTGAMYLLGVVLAGCSVLLMLNVSEQGASDIGLVVTYVFAITVFMQLLATMVTQFLTMLTALERLLQCLQEVPQEPAWELAKDKVLPLGWPTNGAIEFCNASLVYRAGLPPALDQVSLRVPGGTSAGIVGRTGSGKSSLLVLLFRIVEAAAGEVLLDGVNISTLGLHALRKSMAIIPQEPLLLEGSVRMNVDPFDDKSFEEVNQVCSRVGLACEKIMDVTVGTGRSELSAGQKQLVSLARTLLQAAKVIVFDEPTSNIDPATDEKLQEAMRAEFAGRTTLTIAHRLETILSCDQIIVMDSGRVKESGAPQELLADPNSIFSGMASKHGAISLVASI